jgi:acetoin utilization protein AcuB
MSPRIVAVQARDSVTRARELMARHQVHHLPVLRGRRLIGIISDRDLRAADKTVAEVMTAKPVSISADASVDEAARVMRKNRFSAIPVLERSQLVGILTSSDVLDAFVDLSGVAEPSTRITLTSDGRPSLEPRIREIIHHCHGELKWMHRKGHRLHLRLKTRKVDDIVTQLEGAGFNVIAVVSTRKPGRNAAR